MDRHDTLWPLVLPKKEVGEVFAVPEGTSMSTVGDALETLINSSSLGERIFTFALQDILAHKVQRVIKTELATLKGKDRLKEVDMRESKRKMLASIEQVDGIEGLTSRRTIEVEYRNLVFKMKVCSYQEQLELCSGAALRGWMTQAGALKALPGEAVICGKDDDCKLKTFDASYGKDAAAARRYIGTLMATEDKKKHFAHVKATHH
eukprot:1835478-Amphidinium_carterae.1